MDIKALRPDWEVAKNIAHRSGLKEAQDWMRAPLVDLRGLRCTDGATIDHIRAGFLLRHRLFDKAVYLFNTHSHKGHKMGFGLVYLWAETGTPSKPWLWLTRYLRVDGDKWAWVDLINLRVAEWQIKEIDRNPYVTPDVYEAAAHALTVEWLHALDTIDNSDSYPVTIKPERETLTPKQARKLAKTNNTKPWLNPRAPRVIMLNPTKRYPEHGRGGSHASPMPHQRRGHWRTLQAERYGDRRGQRVWVKPAWIGPLEWAYKGNVYRVIEQANG